jgi:hypothetical protein
MSFLCENFIRSFCPFCPSFRVRCFSQRRPHICLGPNQSFRRRPGVFRSVDLGNDLEMIPEAAWSEQPSSKRQGSVINQCNVGVKTYPLQHFHSSSFFSFPFYKINSIPQDYENPSNPEPSVRIGTRHSSTPNVLLHDKDVNI